MLAMRRANVFIGLLAAVIILAVLFFDRILLFSVSKYAGIDLSYSGSRLAGRGAMELRDFRVRDRKRGAELYAKNAVVGLARRPSLERGLAVRFRLDDASFKKSQPLPEARRDAISRIAMMPFEGSWVYSAISGDAVFTGRTLRLKDFLAVGKDIRFEAECVFYANDTVDADMKISFSRPAVEKFPEELTSVILQDDGGWKTLELHLKGDYATPSIQLSGKLFRLNIRGQ